MPSATEKRTKKCVTASYARRNDLSSLFLLRVRSIIDMDQQGCVMVKLFDQVKDEVSYYSSIHPGGGFFFLS